MTDLMQALLDSLGAGQVGTAHIDTDDQGDGPPTIVITTRGEPAREIERWTYSPVVVVGGEPGHNAGASLVRHGWAIAGAPLRDGPAHVVVDVERIGRRPCAGWGEVEQINWEA